MMCIFGQFNYSHTIRNHFGSFMFVVSDNFFFIFLWGLMLINAMRRRQSWLSDKLVKIVRNYPTIIHVQFRFNQKYSFPKNYIFHSSSHSMHPMPKNCHFEFLMQMEITINVENYRINNSTKSKLHNAMTKRGLRQSDSWHGKILVSWSFVACCKEKFSDHVHYILFILRLSKLFLIHISKYHLYIPT